jgi:predicted enzyme related to lactoylglutathione lyase
MANGVGKIKCINIHTTDSAVSVKFWSAVLGRKVTNEYLPYTELKEEGQTKVVIEQVSDPIQNYCGIHFDIKVQDIQKAISTVQKLGGKLIEIKTKEEWSWAIMQDPDGNVFCLCD